MSAAHVNEHIERKEKEPYISEKNSQNKHQLAILLEQCQALFGKTPKAVFISKKHGLKKTKEYKKQWGRLRRCEKKQNPLRNIVSINCN